jgi:hypothetical protein
LRTKGESREPCHGLCFLVAMPPENSHKHVKKAHDDHYCCSNLYLRRRFFFLPIFISCSCLDHFTVLWQSLPIAIIRLAAVWIKFGLGLLTYSFEMIPTGKMSVLRVLLASLVPSFAAIPGIITYDSLGGAPYAVSYDNRSLFINEQRSLFFSFGMHYTRATQAQWDDILAKAANDGYTMVQTYVFWNAHQHKEGDWDFDGPIAGNYNLTLFLERAQAHGLFVNLRIGPYVCAEWNFGEPQCYLPRYRRAPIPLCLHNSTGGFPFWLTGVPGLVDRTSAPAWEAQMGTFFNRVIATVRDFFADRGGPIALAQVRVSLTCLVCGCAGESETRFNRWSQVENEYNGGDSAYVDWCGELAANATFGNQYEVSMSCRACVSLWHSMCIVCPADVQRQERRQYDQLLQRRVLYE